MAETHPDSSPIVTPSPWSVVKAGTVTSLLESGIGAIVGALGLGLAAAGFGAAFPETLTQILTSTNLPPSTPVTPLSIGVSGAIAGAVGGGVFGAGAGLVDGVAHVRMEHATRQIPALLKDVHEKAFERERATQHELDTQAAALETDNRKHRDAYIAEKSGKLVAQLGK